MRPLAILGQPDVQNQRLDNPLVIPSMLSFLTYKSWTAHVDGLDQFPKSEWPDNIPLLYFSYHIMVGLGTLFIAILVISAWLLMRGKLYGSRIMLWTIMLALPFPFIANTAGWITAEVGRQPWIIYGLMRTQRRSVIERFGGKRVVHSYRISRHVHDSRNPFSFPRVSRNRSWPRTAGSFARR